MHVRLMRFHLVGFLAALFVGASLQGGTIAITDIVDPDPDVHLNFWHPTFTYYHDINDDSFDPDLDTVISGEISINLGDDYDILPDPWSQEWVRISIDGENLGTFEVDYGTYGFSVDVSYLQTDGMLEVTLRRKWGDFYFNSSTLDVVVDRPGSGGGVQPVPEPSSLLLFAAGTVLLSAAGLLRRRRKTPL